MNIMSFNVYFIDKETEACNREDIKIDATVKTRGKKLNSLLVSEKIDLAGVQEISQPWLSWLESGLDDQYGYLGMVSTPSVAQGVYIIYRKAAFEVLEQGGFWLADGAPQTAVVGWDGRFERGCSWALLRCKEQGSLMLFFSTHMDHIGLEARSRGAALLTQKTEELQLYVKQKYGVLDCPAVLVGDMNSRPDTDAYENLTKSLKDSRICSRGDTFDASWSTSPGMCYHENEADFRRDGHIIDYVFVSQDIEVNRYGMVQTASNLCPYGAYISDHNAVIADISL